MDFLCLEFDLNPNRVYLNIEQKRNLSNRFFMRKHGFYEH